MTRQIKTAAEVMQAADNAEVVAGRYHGIAFTGSVEKSRYNHSSGLEDLYIILDDLSIFDGTPFYQSGRSATIILSGWSLAQGLHTVEIAE